MQTGLVDKAGNTRATLWSPRRGASAWCVGSTRATLWSPRRGAFSEPRPVPFETTVSAWIPRTKLLLLRRRRRRRKNT
ncbi:hypothetical protein E2C01_031122 [Portunus trituberculatus]|uniref:Uncharacterized protein n=1 Tax=Portunus trituberculatus TaxID=210409 RepID=A0A5B7EZ88_PORTR|nr:hypothetical protein [Portunus trituberculatus]